MKWVYVRIWWIMESAAKVQVSDDVERYRNSGG